MWISRWISLLTLCLYQVFCLWISGQFRLRAFNLVFYEISFKSIRQQDFILKVGFFSVLCSIFVVIQRQRFCRFFIKMFTIHGVLCLIVECYFLNSVKYSKGYTFISSRVFMFTVHGFYFFRLFYTLKCSQITESLFLF